MPCIVPAEGKIRHLIELGEVKRPADAGADGVKIPRVVAVKERRRYLETAVIAIAPPPRPFQADAVVSPLRIAVVGARSCNCVPAAEPPSSAAASTSDANPLYSYLLVKIVVTEIKRNVENIPVVGVNVNFELMS